MLVRLRNKSGSSNVAASLYLSTSPTPHIPIIFSFSSSLFLEDNYYYSFSRMSVILSWLSCSSLIAKEEVWTGSKVLLDGDCLQARTASLSRAVVWQSHTVLSERTQTLGSRGAVSLTHVLVWPVPWDHQVCVDGSLWKPIEWSAITCSALKPEQVMFSSVFFSGANLYVLRHISGH